MQTFKSPECLQTDSQQLFTAILACRVVGAVARHGNVAANCPPSRLSEANQSAGVLQLIARLWRCLAPGLHVPPPSAFL